MTEKKNRRHKKQRKRRITKKKDGVVVRDIVPTPESNLRQAAVFGQLKFLQNLQNPSYDTQNRSRPLTQLPSQFHNNPNPYQAFSQMQQVNPKGLPLTALDTFSRLAQQSATIESKDSTTQQNIANLNRDLEAIKEIKIVSDPEKGGIG